MSEFLGGLITLVILLLLVGFALYGIGFCIGSGLVDAGL